jgi:phosphoglucomutase
MELLTGNQIGSLIAEYRLMKYKEMGWIPKEGSPNACIIKTFVTTQLQDAIGRGHGVKVIDTLTGFKWIAAKIRGYEERLKAAMGPGWDYDRTPFAERAQLLLGTAPSSSSGPRRATATCPTTTCGTRTATPPA